MLSVIPSPHWLLSFGGRAIVIKKEERKSEIHPSASVSAKILKLITLLYQGKWQELVLSCGLRGQAGIGKRKAESGRESFRGRE